MKGKILCFGELLLRLSPSPDGSWLQDNTLPVYIGGAEANVAAALAKWETPVKYYTALPDHYLTKNILHQLQHSSIDVSAVQLSGKRIGLYFLQQGSDLKNAEVIYDREFSAFSQLQTGTIDWDEILRDVCWFHFSAISPAISENAAAVCREALLAATRKNIPVSVDLNYRAKLWQYGKQPVEIMATLLPYCSLVMGNIWSAAILLGLPLFQELLEKNSREAYLQHSLETSRLILGQYPSCQQIANTFRFDEGSRGIRYFATLFGEGILEQSPQFQTPEIADKVGSGDCFMAGLLYGRYHNLPNREVLNFAAAAAFGKFQEKSDATSQTVAQIRTILKRYE